MTSDSKDKKVAGTKKRTGSGSNHKALPAFVGKLWQMVNDPANSEFIRWMPDGKSIQVVHREAFEKNLLPRYFKHNNFSSFVRQLNMYGWHKVQDLNSGSMHNNEEFWQFQSPYFVRGHEELLDNIVRNKGGKQGEDDEESPADINKLYNELETIKNKQIIIGEDLFRIRKDNELLWSEYYASRDRHEKHTQMLDRILRFLASVYGQGGKFLDMMGSNSPVNQRRLMGSLDPAQASGAPPRMDYGTTPAQIQELQELQDMQSRIKESATTPDSIGPTGSTTSSGNTPTSPLSTSSSHANLSTSPKATPNNALVPGRRASANIRAYSAPPAEAPSGRSDSIGSINSIGSMGRDKSALILSQPSQGARTGRAAGDAAAAPPSFNAAASAAAGGVHPQALSNPGNAPHSNYASEFDPFSELTNMSSADGRSRQPSMTPEQLEALSQQISLQDSSLQNVHEMLQRLTPDVDMSDFNVDDFLVDPDVPLGETGPFTQSPDSDLDRADDKASLKHQMEQHDALQPPLQPEIKVEEPAFKRTRMV